MMGGFAKVTIKPKPRISDIRNAEPVEDLMGLLRRHDLHCIVGTSPHPGTNYYGHVDDERNYGHEANRGGRTPLSALRKAALAYVGAWK